MAESLLKSMARTWFRWYLNRFPLRDGKARLYQALHKYLVPSERFMVAKIDPGFRLNCDLQDPEQLKIYFYGHYHERYEARLVKKLLSPGDNFWDIGANIGYFTLLAATALKNTGRIVALEPGGTAYRTLLKNIGLNDFTNITPVNLAASNSVGEAKLYLTAEIADTGANLFQAGDERTQCETIHTMPLDVFLTQEHLPPPQFLKIDVEGAELAVLQGATRILAEFSPLLLLEMEEKTLQAAGTNKAAIQTWLTPFGYQGAFLHKGRWIFIEDMSKSKGRNIFWFNPGKPWHQKKIRPLGILAV
jgi:FkbM family methyltransferase